jgi:N-acetylglucosamine-6-phosphate deacetylase
MPSDARLFAISAPNIFDGTQCLRDHCVVLRGDRIVGVPAIADCPADAERIILTEGTLAPGFIDLQVNGGGDALFNADPSAACLHTIARAHRRKGTTSLLPTVLSNTPQVHKAAATAVQEARSSGLAGILGLHIEGPFFATARRGVHAQAHLRAADDEDIAWLCGLRDFPVVLTLAPENFSPALISQLAASGIHVCAGHTEASYAQLVAAAAAGLSGVTHLYNAMSPLQTREPGCVGAALDTDTLWAGIIADGHHVHPAAIRLAQRLKPPGKLVLVSDAMATVGGSCSSFDLYGETISEQSGKLVNHEGRLAGSAIALIDAVRFCVEEAKISLEESLRMASCYPAGILGLADTLGSLHSGARADLVHFDDAFGVRNTWLCGERETC